MVCSWKQQLDTESCRRSDETMQGKDLWNFYLVWQPLRFSLYFKCYQHFSMTENKPSVNKHQPSSTWLAVPNRRAPRLWDNDAQKALSGTVLTWTIAVENRKLSVLFFVGLMISLKLERFWAHLWPSWFKFSAHAHRLPSGGHLSTLWNLHCKWGRREQFLAPKIENIHRFHQVGGWFHMVS